MKRNNQKRKILLISNKVYHYRLPVYQHLNDRFGKIGYELVVITNEVERNAAEEVAFQLHVIPFGFLAYRRAILQHNPSVVIFFLHVRDLIVWPLLLWLKICRTGVVYWNHGINLQTPNNLLKRIVFGLLHHYADAIILYSSNEKKFIARRYWKKLFVANNTINFDSIPEISDSKDSIREQLNVTFRKVVLFVGRITESKRLDDLIAAAAYLDPGTGVVIVGEGLSARQSQIVRESKNIQYLGAIYDAESINRVFKMADVFSIPGKVGLGVNQAFYWGLPIVTENVRHSPEFVYVKDGFNGFVVDRHDTKMLAEKINLLLASDATYRRFSDAARSEILENANIDKMCDGFIDAVRFLDQRNDCSAEFRRTKTP